MIFWDWARIWQKSRENWHWPQLPTPRMAKSGICNEFPFQNYSITLDQATLAKGSLYLENLFDHLIVHYIFCPRSLELASQLALASLKVLQVPARARQMVNIFSDIVVDSFRLERSSEDEKKVLMGWRSLAEGELTPLEKIVLGFLSEYWGVPLYSCSAPEVDLLYQVFSYGVRDKSLWPRQCQETSRILGPFLPRILGRGQVRTMEMLNGSAHAVPLTYATDLEPGEYEKILAVIGQKGDLKRWYRDQIYSIEIREVPESRRDSYPSSPVKWRLTDPCSELDIAYSLSMGPTLIPGVSTYKRGREWGEMVPGSKEVPDLMVVLDSSRSMDGPRKGTRTHKATLAAFKACQFAHGKGAEVAAINFSEKYLLATWTRDLNSVEDVLVEFLCARTHIPGKAVLDLAIQRPGCIILCITDTHIQNLYQEWEDLKKASNVGEFVLFCIDEAYKDKHVEESLASLGQVYFINRLEDLVSLVVDVTARAYAGESFISVQ